MNLNLPLKREWFDLTDKEIKTEDYREINQYWFKRLVFQYKKVFKYFTGYDWDDDVFRDEGIQHIIKTKQNMFGFKDFSINVMKLGYPKNLDNDRIRKFVHLGIEIGKGKEEWGAEKGKDYFIIKHGTKIIN